MTGQEARDETLHVPEDYAWRYCQEDGEDWPCSTIRAAAAEPPTCCRSCLSNDLGEGCMVDAS